MGGALDKRRAFETFLAKHGYIVAPVTVDNDDFVYAAAYAAALRAGEADRAARIADDYFRYMLEVFSYFRRSPAESPVATSRTSCCCTSTL